MLDCPDTHLEFVRGLGSVGGLVFAAFPRGSGFYFDIIKLVPLLLLFFCWVPSCSWVDRDSRELGLPVLLWNSAMWACFAFGLAVVWLLPWFWLSFGFLLLFYLAPTLGYCHLRNQEVSYENRVLTK